MYRSTRPIFSEVEDLVELGEIKRARLSAESEPKPEQCSHAGKNSPEIRAPVLTSTLVEDESHFLLSRTIPSTPPDTSNAQLPENHTKNDQKLPKNNSTVEKESELARQNA